MNFLSPAFLIGLPLVAVPVVIHLLSRRQQKRISWGAMRFLIQATTHRRRLWRLTDILLLLLRTAALLAFIFALARPLLPSTWLGGSLPREVVLILDQSLSMTRRTDGASAFERLQQHAGSQLDLLHNADTVRILLAGESPEWLAPEPIAASTPALRSLRARIQDLKPTLGGADLTACLREAIDLEPARDKAERRIVVLTDGQRFGWRLEEQPVWTALASRRSKASIPTTIDFDEVVASPDTGNLSVQRIETPRSFGAVHQAMSLTATVQNHGSEPSAAALLSWRVNDVEAGVSTVPDLAPGASASVSMVQSFETPGVSDVTCHLDVLDALPADNDGHLLIEIFDRLPILVVEDPGSAEPLENDRPFILAALGGASERPQTTPGWQSVFDPTVIDSRTLESTDLSRYRAVILANPRRLSEKTVQSLEGFARNGGGVWIALGNQTDLEAFNTGVFRAGQGLSPMKLKAPVGDPGDRANFFTVRAASDAHPATSLLSDFQRLDLDRARVYRRFPFDAFSGRDVSVLLQVQGGDPAVIERKLGSGRVIIQGFPLGVSWSTLPLCQAYVAMLHEWLWYLSEPGLPRRNLAVGETLIAAAGNPKDTARWILPNGNEVAVAASSSPGGSRFRFVSTRLPGEYRLRAAASKDPSTDARFYVQRDPKESNLAALTEDDRHQLATLNGSSNDSLTAAATPPPPPRHPLDGWLLGALPFLLLGEMAIAGWTTHRRNLRVPPVTMDA